VRRVTEYFVELLCWIAFVYSMLLVVVAVDSLYALLANDLTDTRQKFYAVLQDLIPKSWGWLHWMSDWFNQWMVLILFIMGAMSFLIGLFFLSKIIVLHRERKRIVHPASRGHIQISIAAVHSFIERLLISEFGLRKFRILIYQPKDGLDVLIRATIPVGRNVLQTGERMQKLIQERVEERLGVKVKKIEIVAQGVVGEGETVVDEDEEGNRLYSAGGEVD